MKRQGDFNNQVWMQTNFTEAEILPSGIRIYNLPPAPPPSAAEGGESSENTTGLKQYVKSTSDFLSQVTPNGTSGVGLGAGFGQRPDKRLGWLRPRQKDHLTPLPPEEEKELLLKKTEEEGIQDLPEAKTPEERKEQIQRMLTYMKSFEGTTLSGTGGHTLLADLDFEKDSLLFGRTRDEFIHNVETLKRVILNYEKWERTDNFYRYGTIFMQFSCVWLLVDCLQTHSRFQLLRDHFDDFVEATEEEIVLLQTKRAHDRELARQEFALNTPNFDSVIDQIVVERRRQESGEEEAKQKELVSHPMDTTKEALTLRAQSEEQRRRDMRIFLDHSEDEMEKEKKQKSSSQGGWKKFLFGWASSSNAHRGDDDGKKNEDPKSLSPTATTTTKRPLITAEDVVRYSYAAAPTSIATVRALRRVLLPRSDDFTQIVREEMEAYRLAKDSEVGYK